MPYCSAPGCKNTSKCTNLSFFSYPIYQPNRLEQWLRFIGRAGFMPTRTARLCSVHFEEWCFEEDIYLQIMGQDPLKRRRARRLVNHAYPTIFVRRDGRPVTERTPHPFATRDRRRRCKHERKVSDYINTAALSMLLSV